MIELPVLGDRGARDPRRVGHKAAMLSRLGRLARVPAGFCVPGDIGIADMGSSIAAAYDALSIGDEQAAVAVRSSALDEDGSDASFAGQYETVLNVVGVTAIAEAVIRCRESAVSPVVTSYRRDRGLPPPVGCIPVFVQRLIPADASAVAFSIDPVTRAHDRILINANWGLGESIVSGRVTPDSFVVGKLDSEIRERVIAVKTTMTVTAPGGTRDVATPAELRNRASLDDLQVQVLARLAGSLEAECRGAVDIECAFLSDTLWLLQCRPVTTAARI
jgi:pyruvate,water dikinase